MMRIVLSGNRIFKEIVKLNIDGDRVVFTYWDEVDGELEQLEQVTSKEAIEKIEYEFILDE
jgi:hypothetical protein